MNKKPISLCSCVDAYRYPRYRLEKGEGIMKELISGKRKDEFIKQHPILNDVISMKEIFWENPGAKTMDSSLKNLSFGENEVKDAESRLERFAPYIMKVFPETIDSEGIIESPLIGIPKMKNYFNKE